MRAILIAADGKSRDVTVGFPPEPEYVERRAMKRMRRVVASPQQEYVDVRFVRTEEHVLYQLVGGSFMPQRETDLAIYQEVGRTVASAAA